MDWILDQFVSRVKSLGGKNLCEYSKKMMTAVWLHLRGDGVSIGRYERNQVK